MDFGFYFKVFLRRLPYFLVMLILGSTIGVALAVMLPSTYTSTAKLVVESEQIPDELAASTVQTQADEQLQLIQQRILTRDTLLEMANRLGIYARSGSAQMPADLKVDDLRSRIHIQMTMSGSKRRGGTDVLFFTVGFDAPTAKMAAEVANELVTLILRENVDMRTTVAGQTLDFFRQEAERLDRELSRMSSAILKFQEENIDSLPDSLDFRRSQQAAQQERLLQLERQETVLRDRRQRLVDLYERSGGNFPGNEVPAAQMTPEARQLQALKNEYASSVAVLSLDNPKVAVLKSRIEALEKVVANQQAAAQGMEPAGGKPLSAYDIQLADIDTQLSYLADQKTQIEKNLAALKKTIEATPGNAAQLDTMQREYNNVKTQYNQAVASRSRAETGDMIESLSKGQRISVLEQALPPREPESPNRPLLAAAGIGGGLVMGIGLVLLLELLNSAIRRPVDLNAKLGITALATVPYIWTRQQVMRRRLIIAGIFAAVLIGVPAGLWIVDTQITPLNPLLNRILDRFNISLASDLPGMSGPIGG